MFVEEERRQFKLGLGILLSIFIPLFIIVLWIARTDIVAVSIFLAIFGPTLGALIITIKLAAKNSVRESLLYREDIPAWVDRVIGSPQDSTNKLNEGVVQDE